MITAIVLRLRTTDLAAHSTGDLLGRLHGTPGVLAAVDRSTVWMCEWAACTPHDSALVALVRPGVLFNPNKESARVAHDPDAILCDAGPRDALVATWPHDHEAGVLAQGILRRAGCDPAVLASVWCVTLWGLRAGSGTESLGSFAAEVAEVRSRGRGVLANPHLASSAVFTSELTLRALAEVSAPCPLISEGVSA